MTAGRLGPNLPGRRTESCASASSPTNRWSPPCGRPRRGTAVADICRKLEITETTFYRWKRKFGDLGVTERRELKQLRDENKKLKQLVAELSLDKTILREALKRKW